MMNLPAAFFISAATLVRRGLIPSPPLFLADLLERDSLIRHAGFALGGQFFEFFDV